MDTHDSAIDLADFIPQDTSTLEILKPGGLEGTGWKVEFAGPAHPKTIAWSEATTRKNLRRASQIEQAQVNGKKFKTEDREPDDVRRENVGFVVARILGWTPVRLGSAEPIAFSEPAAIELLSRPNMGWALAQMVEYLTDERSFTRGSAKTSEPSLGTTSPSLS